MKALTCEMCGSTNLVKDGSVFVCQSCGTKYSVEEAKKMMVEGTVDVKGTVKVDTTDELKNLYEIARRARDTNNNENAAKYYDMILVKDPKSWEANYYVIYFKSIGCTIGGIYSALLDMRNCQSSVIQLIKDNENEEGIQKAALTQVSLRNSIITKILFNAAKNHYDNIDFSIKFKYAQNFVDSADAAVDILYNFGNIVETKFNGKYSDVSIKSWKDGINIHKEHVKYIDEKERNINTINSYGDKIKKYDSSYVTPNVETDFDTSIDTSACYVATAVYGSYDCPEVWTLRRFRDFTLDATWYGRLFIKAYYATSPTFVKYFGNVKIFKSQGKKLLDKWVAKLNRQGYESTPYKDKY